MLYIHLNTLTFQKSGVSPKIFVKRELGFFIRIFFFGFLFLGLHTCDSVAQRETYSKINPKKIAPRRVRFAEKGIYFPVKLNLTESETKRSAEISVELKDTLVADIIEKGIRDLNLSRSQEYVLSFSRMGRTFMKMNGKKRIDPGLMKTLIQADDVYIIGLGEESSVLYK